MAEGEYLRNMREARVEAGAVRWVEVCYCPTPLLEGKRQRNYTVDERRDW